jgi:hypothetical protein
LTVNTLFPCTYYNTNGSQMLVFQHLFELEADTKYDGNGLRTATKQVSE